MVAGRLRSLPDMPEVKTFKCHQEATEPDRAGFIQYTNMGYTNGTCSIVFRGEQRDMVIINMDTLILRYFNNHLVVYNSVFCKSSLEQRIREKDKTGLLTKFQTFHQYKV